MSLMIYSQYEKSILAWFGQPGQYTEVRFASFLSGGFTTMHMCYGSNKPTGKETGKMHLCALQETIAKIR